VITSPNQDYGIDNYMLFNSSKFTGTNMNTS